MAYIALVKEDGIPCLPDGIKFIILEYTGPRERWVRSAKEELNMCILHRGPTFPHWSTVQQKIGDANGLFMRSFEQLMSTSNAAMNELNGTDANPLVISSIHVNTCFGCIAHRFGPSKLFNIF